VAGRSVNVELRVKAQDEASKALDTVAKSLKDLGSAGTALQGGSGGVGKFVEDLGKNLGSLDALFKKLDSGLVSASKAYDLQSGRLAALNNSITERRRRIEELTATEARYQQQLSKTFVGPREQDVTKGALSKVARDLKSQTSGLQADIGRIDALIGKIADARDATQSIRAVQGDVAGAIRQTNAEYLKQIDTLNKLTVAEKAAGAEAERAANNRAVAATVNRNTGVTGGTSGNTGLRAIRQTDLERTFAPVFAAEDAASTRDAAAALKVAEAQAKETADALAQVQRYARDVAEALDPAAKASRLLADEQSRLNAAVSGGFLSQGQADAQLQRFKAGLDGSALAAEKADREFQSLSTYVQELRREFDRAGYAEQFLVRETAKLDKALTTVDKTTGKSILSQKEYVKALEAVRRKSEQLGEQSNPQLFGLNPYQTQNLLFQFNDIATQLASGTSLSQTLAQQGGQILQLFPKVGNAVTGAFRYFPAAIGGAVAAIGTLVIAINEALTAADRLRDLQAVLRATADGANYNAGELVKVAKSMAAIGIATDDAMKIVRIATKSGFDQSAIRDFGEAAKGLAVVLGSDIPTAAQSLADALTGGYDALVELDKQINAFTDSELNSIRALIENGDALGANAEATKILTERYGNLAREADGPWDKAINNLSDSWERLKTSLANSNVIQGIVTALTAVANVISDIVGGIDKISSNPVGASIFGAGLVVNPATAIAAASAFGRTTRPAATAAAPQSELDAILARAGGGIKRTATGFTGATASDSAFYAAEIKRANELLGIQKQSQTTVRDTYRDARERAKAEGKVTTEAEKQKKLAEDIKRIRVEVNRELGAPRNAEERRIAEELVQERLNKKADEYNTQLKQIAETRKRSAEQAEREAAALAKQQNTGLFQAKALLRELEGIGGKFSRKAYNDEGTPRLGFGSDTITNPDGTYRRVQYGDTTTKEGAERDLDRRINSLIDVLEKRLGGERFKKFSAQQQGAIISLYYNYGVNSKRLAQTLEPVLREGTEEEIAAAVRQLANDRTASERAAGRNLGRNGKPINYSRRMREADILGQPNLSITEGAKEVDDKRGEQQREFNADLEDEVSKRQRSVEAQRELVGLQGEALLAAQKEQAVQEAIAAARAKLRDKLNDPNAQLTGDQESAIRSSVGAGFDLQTTGVVQGELQTKVNELLALRDSIQAQIQSELERGNTGTARALEEQLGTTNGALRDAAQQLLDYQIANAEALGLSSEALDTLKLKQDALNESTRQWTSILGIGGQQIANTFTSLAVSAIDKFAQAVANGENAFGSLLTAFREFAANFLIQIAQMIQQQIIFNLVSGLLSSIGGGLGGGGAGAATNSLGGGFSNFNLSGLQFHSGGVVGSGGQFRSINPAMFANATRYHSGGIAGLKPGEVPSILMRGEEVLTRDDPRHMLNGGGGRGDVKIVNTFDAEDFFSKGANTKAGEKAIMNLVRNNPRAFKQAMGGG